MNQQYIRAAELIALFLQENISLEELEELKTLGEKYPTIASWMESKDLSLQRINERMFFHQSLEVEKTWESVLTKKKERLLSIRNLTIRWVVAASIVFISLVGASIFVLTNSDKPRTDSPYIAAIKPGSDRAILTLSDGTTVLLGDSTTQSFADGDLRLDAVNNMLDYRQAQGATPQMHKLQVPFGGTYHIQLEDGTKVWLNADSELEFPSAFVGTERKVKVRGEAYFEIAKNPLKPFKVDAEGTMIEALGTAFNVNSHLYKGKIKTILTEGKIKVSTGGISETIDDGYETISSQEGIQVNKADIEEALAWKEGYFYFNSKQLNELLEDIARWYKVDLDIRVRLTDKKYMGGIKKSESIEKVCAILDDLTPYNITLKKQKLIITQIKK